MAVQSHGGRCAGYDPPMLRCALCINVLVLCVLLAMSSSTHAGADALFLSASGEQHLWLVSEAQTGRRVAEKPQLLHHALDMAGPYVSRGPEPLGMPEAMAVAGARVWIVYPPTQVNGELRREVYSVQAQRDPGIGMYHTVPRDRMQLVSALPGWGKLAGFAAGRSEPVALLVPHQRDAADVRRDGEPAYDSPPRSPMLLQLRGGSWQEQPLPEFALPAEPAWHIGFDGSGLRRLNILVSSQHEREQSVLHQRADHGTWQLSVHDIDASAVRVLTHSGGRLAAVIEQDDRVDIVYIRPSSLLHLAGFDSPAGTWAVHGLDDGFYLLHQRNSELTMATISLIDGAMGEAKAVADQPLPTAKLWHTGLMLAVSVIAVLIVLLVRPGSRAVVELPKNTAVLPALPRVVAMLIDLVPGGVLTVVLLRVSPAELLRLPMMTETLDQSAAHLLMLGIMALHCTISEMLRGTTLGKAVVGGFVRTSTGAPISIGQALARNGVKVMILLVPPLAVFALFNPYMQGFNDMAARTMVLRATDEPAESDAE